MNAKRVFTVAIATLHVTTQKARTSVVVSQDSMETEKTVAKVSSYLKVAQSSFLTFLILII